MTKRIVFRYDAGLRVGMGHHVRCHALSSWFGGDKISFIAGVDNEGRRALANCDDTFCLPVNFPEPEERDWWRVYGVAVDAVVFDLSYAERVARRDKTLNLMRQLGSAVACRIVIDALGSQALVGSDDASGFDALFIPYAGAQVPHTACPVFVGADYFMVPRSWPSQPNRDVCREVRHILITMGGSDPYGLTLRALDGVMLAAGADWSIRAVIGPAFNRTLADAIRRRAEVDPRITPIEAPPNLVPHLFWADLAVATTGLTKYELAWAGLASVQISIDRLQAALNASFAAEQTAIHLGAAEDVDAVAIAAAIADLTSDAAGRVIMSKRGQALVDGRGGDRAAKVIHDIINARH